MIGAERDHQPDRRDDEPRAERLHVEKGAAEEHHAADDDERERLRVRGRADRVAQRRVHVLCGDASLPAQVEERDEEEPDGDEPEPDQLGVLVGSACRPFFLFVVRFFTRDGSGRSGRFFLLAAMEARSTPTASALHSSLGAGVASARSRSLLRHPDRPVEERRAAEREQDPQRLPSIVATAPTPSTSAPIAATAT